MVIYLNIKGRIFETDKPNKVKQRIGRFGIPYGYVALYDKQQNAEEKRDGYYCRELHESEGVIRNNALWLKEPNLEMAKEIFYQDMMKRFNKINKKFNEILDEKERMEESLL